MYIDETGSDANHPIDIAEIMAVKRGWEFDRVADDQIAMGIGGMWGTYSITLAWDTVNEVLRFICTFDFDPPEEKIAAVYDLINRCNEMTWYGAFNYWGEHKLMVWRYGLLLSGQQTPTVEQVHTMIKTGEEAVDRFYPSFQLVTCKGFSPADAIKAAIAKAYGRA